MIANLYYLQPLLGLVAVSFNIPITDAGFLVTLTQAGYALGILLIVPLGDVLDRRSLLTGMFAVNAAGLVAAALSPSFALFCAASLVFGITSAAAMVIIPYVASITPEAVRGRLVGQMMTGALLAIPLAWTIAGFIGSAVGWRPMYVGATAMTLLLLVLLRSNLPIEADRPSGPVRYPQLLKSLYAITREQPRLRERALYSALGMAGFSAFWTGLPFLLSRPPFEFQPSTIGLFGLTGIFGALAASLVGRLADRGLVHQLTGGLSVLLLASWGTLLFGEASLWAVVAGSALLNIAVMGLQVTHQSVIYRLEPGARSRITAVFITSAFLGASLGSALATVAFQAFGWNGLCAVGASLPGLLLLLWALARRDTDIGAISTAMARSAHDMNSDHDDRS